VDIHGKSPTVPQDLHFVLNAKVLTFIGQKKIEVMPAEEGEEKGALVSVDHQ
jgi:hypothetical protein